MASTQPFKVLLKFELSPISCRLSFELTNSFGILVYLNVISNISKKRRKTKFRKRSEMNILNVVVIRWQNFVFFHCF
jgi:hypothetical protein